VPSIPGFKANVKGLNRVEASADMLIAFSTSLNAVAEEGVYAPILAEELLRPGRTAEAAFADVQRRVARDTGRRQLPWTNNLLYNSVCFAGCGNDQLQTVTPAAPRPQSATPAPAPAATTYLDARSTPASTRAPLVSDPRALSDFALFRECEGCPEMVILPAATFVMGSTHGNADEKPTRQVSIPRFAMSRFETTGIEWDACVKAGVCNGVEVWGSGLFSEYQGRGPVYKVTWNEARTFAGFVTGRSGATYRLPSEAEWEYAARAGSGDEYSWGPVDPSCDAKALAGANFDACKDDQHYPGGGFRFNRYGLFDLHGNLWEWVEDCYAESYAAGQSSDGRAYSPSMCSHRAIRGGSYSDPPQDIRSANRSKVEPATRSIYLGFRVARTL
jgi:formylglycine-generating enzyme required for sulfatase activity